MRAQVLSVGQQDCSISGLQLSSDGFSATFVMEVAAQTPDATYLQAYAQVPNSANSTVQAMERRRTSAQVMVSP